MNPFYDAPTLVIVSSKPNEKAPAIGLANASCIIMNCNLSFIFFHSFYVNTINKPVIMKIPNMILRELARAGIGLSGSIILLYTADIVDKGANKTTTIICFAKIGTGKKI